MKVKNEMKLEFTSIPDNIAFARVAIAAFASQLDFTLPDLDEIKVAISEAVSNSIIHGYGNSPKGKIIITACIKNDKLEITVSDKGRGIEDIEQALMPSFSTDPERMGLGFVFMQSFMDDFQVNSEPNKGTEVKMAKNLQVNINNGTAIN